MMDEQILKECIKTLLCDSIRYMYREKHEAKSSDEIADIQDGINEREELLKKLGETK